MANYFPAFAGLLSGANPDEETPFGVPASDVRMAQAGLLGNIGATLLAAGQRISPADRARLLAQIGPQTAQFSTDIYNAAQRRYQQGMLQEAQAKRAEEAKQRAEEAQQRAQMQEERARLGAMLQPTGMSEVEGGELKPVPSAYGEAQVISQFMKAYPEEGARLFAEMMTPPKPATQTPGTPITLVSPDGTQKRTLHSNDPDFNPLTKAGWTIYEKPPTPPTPAFESELQKITGKALGNVLVGIPKLYTQQANINLMEALGGEYESLGGQTGVVGTALTRAKAALPNMFKSDMPKAAALEAFDSIANKEVMKMIGVTEGGEGFPANSFSNADREFLTKIPPRLENIGYSAKLEISRAINDRAIEFSLLAQKYYEDGLPPDQAMARAAKEASRKEIFTDEVKERLLSTGKSSTRPAGTIEIIG
jgi:hypothetical protein